MTLVELRCKARGCGRLLSNVISVPAEGDEIAWSGMVFVPVCPRHGGGGYGKVAKWVEAQRRLGRPHDRVRTGQWIYWADLRPKLLLARATGRPQVHVV